MKRIILAGLLSCFLAGTASAAPNWPAAPYSYYAEDAPLRDVLREFAAGFSLSLQAGPGLDGVVNGRFNAGTPTEFMDKLGGVYGFNWFVHAGTLFVSRTSDMATRSVSAMGSSITALRDALLQMGVLDPRFGWGELPAQGIALVSGPPAYVKLVEDTVAALPLGAGGQQVAVFRLKHASVNDRTVNYRNQSVVTPGLATVLRNLILGGGGDNNQALSAIAAPLRDNPPVFGAADGMAAAPPLAGGASVSGSTAPADAGNGAAAAPRASGGLRLREPTVQADARLNAIIVQDIPDRIPIYRELIAQLDLPSTLIEIEAMIVDVNSDLVNQLGVTWGARAGSATFGYSNFDLAPSNGLPIDSGADLAPGTIGLSVGSVLAARLRALQTDGQANILSQPSILTADNLGALIDLSDTFYVQTTGERVATVTPITVGTSLRVTPRYIEGSNGRQVELTVDIEDGRIQDERRIGDLPTVRRSNVSTLAVVGDDQTLLIGGYNSTQDSEQIEKVPFLGDIPGLGVLFSNKSSSVLRRERLFLLRPRVVSIQGEPVAPPRAQGQAGPAMNLTWGEQDGDISVGQYLDLVRGQQTRVRFDTVPARTPRGPVRVSDRYIDSVPLAPPVAESYSLDPAAPAADTAVAPAGPVLRIETPVRGSRQ